MILPKKSAGDEIIEYQDDKFPKNPWIRFVYISMRTRFLLFPAVLIPFAAFYLVSVYFGYPVEFGAVIMFFLLIICIYFVWRYINRKN